MRPRVLKNFRAPQGGICHEEQNTTMYINDREVGKGILYITESLLSWVKYETQRGFSLEHLRISLHAISREEHERQCLYIMVKGIAHLPGVLLQPSSDSDSENEDSDEETQFTEMRFAPDNTNNLQAMFQAMNQCQALHSEPQLILTDVEEDIYVDAEEDDFENFEAAVDDFEAAYTLPTDLIYCDPISLETEGTNHNGTEADEAMEIELGQFEDVEEDAFSIYL